MFPPRRSQASEAEPQDVKSASCSSVASSVAARELLQFVCDCGSSEDVEFCGNAPSCSSLELTSDGGNESVGSTSSVAESAIGRRVGAKFIGSSLEWASGGSALDGRTCDPCPLCGGECTGHRTFPGDAYCTCAAQHEWDSPLRPLPKHAVPSFLAEDRTDNDSDSNDEVPCLLSLIHI